MYKKLYNHLIVGLKFFLKINFFQESTFTKIIISIKVERINLFSFEKLFIFLFYFLLTVMQQKKKSKAQNIKYRKIFDNTML